MLSLRFDRRFDHSKSLLGRGFCFQVFVNLSGQFCSDALLCDVPWLGLWVPALHDKLDWRDVRERARIMLAGDDPLFLSPLCWVVLPVKQRFQSPDK
jgi:hypothetical protein